MLNLKQIRKTYDRNVLVVYCSIYVGFLLSLLYVNYFIIEENVVPLLNASSYLIRYENGIVKRAFVGSFLEIVFGKRANQYGFIALIAHGSLILLLVLSALMLIVYLRRSQLDWYETYTAIAVITLFITSNATFERFFNDIARFDIIAASFFILVSFTAMARSLFALVIAGWFFALLAPLVHEIFILMYLPVCAMYFFLIPDQGVAPVLTRNRLIGAIGLIGLAAAGYAFVTFANQPSIQFSEYYAKIEERADFLPGRDPLSPPFWSFSYNQNYTQDFIEEFGLAPLLLSHVIAIPFDLVVVTVLGVLAIMATRRRVGTVHAIFIGLVFLSPLAILPAFFVAIDYGRWIGSIVFTQFILIFVFLSVNPSVRLFETVPRWFGFFALAGVVFNLVIRPLEPAYDTKMLYIATEVWQRL